MEIRLGTGLRLAMVHGISRIAGVASTYLVNRLMDSKKTRANDLDFKVEDSHGQ